MYCFPGNHIEFTSTRKQISYDENNLIPCVEIMDRRAPNVRLCMTGFQHFQGQSVLHEGIFN